MFRSDRDALAGEVDELRREREALLAENAVLRAGVLAAREPRAAFGTDVYKVGPSVLAPHERVALSHTDLDTLPIWAALVLHFVTFGLFSLVYYNLLHSKLPRVQADDPSAGKAIGFSFIPYFNFYWLVWNTIRLTDRVNFQFKLRGLPDAVPRGLLTVCGIVSVIPYVNIASAILLWPVAVFFLQRASNQLAALSREPLVTEAAQSAVRVEAAPAARIAPAESDPGAEAEVEREVAEVEAAEGAPTFRRV